MIIRCANCGAPLDTSAGRKHIKCAYCAFPNVVQQAETVSKETPKDWQPPAVWTPPVEARAESVPLEFKQQPSAARGAFVLLALVVCIGVGAAYLLTSTSSPSTEQTNAPAATSTAKEPAFTTSMLAKLPLGTRQVVAGTEPSGDTQRYDPAADFERMQKLAREWADDARLQAVVLHKVRDDGTLDLHRDGRSAQFRFLSPARLAAAEKMREVSDEKTIGARLLMDVLPEGVRVLLTEEDDWRDKGAPAFDVTCGPKDVIRLWKTEQLPRRPGYDMMLVHNGSRWVWFINQHDLKPRPRQVDAETCKLK